MMKFTIGKRYKWSPYASGRNLWKNGILESIEEKNGHMIGHFITRDDEDWVIPLDAGDVNIELFKK